MGKSLDRISHIISVSDDDKCQWKMTNKRLLRPQNQLIYTLAKGVWKSCVVIWAYSHMTSMNYAEKFDHLNIEMTSDSLLHRDINNLENR